jgi:hypothetical protein
MGSHWVYSGIIKLYFYIHVFFNTTRERTYTKAPIKCAVKNIDVEVTRQLSQIVSI